MFDVDLQTRLPYHARLMNAAEYSVRKLTLQDEQLLFDWANDPDARAQALNPSPISWETHVEWFQKKVNSSDASYWIMKNTLNEPVGLVRFDFSDHVGLISFLLDKKHRGKGLSPLLLALGMEEVARERGAVTFRALVHPDNTPSLKAFLKNGFVPAGSEKHGDRSFQILQRPLIL